MAIEQRNTGNKQVLTLKRVRNDVPANDPFYHEPLDFNDVPTRISGLPQATKSNAVGTSGYIAPYADLGACPLPVVTPVAVVVNYSLTKDENPHVDAIIVPVKNGVSIGNIYGNSTSSFAGIMSGDTVYIGLAHDIYGTPWPAGASASMIITADGVTMFNSGVKSNPNILDLANYTFVAQAGVVYNVVVTSNSDSVDYFATTYSMNNISTSPVIPLSGNGEIIGFEFIDNSNTQIIAHSGQYIQPHNNIGMNWLLSGVTGRFKVYNNSGVDIGITLANTAHGGGFSQYIVVLAGTIGTIEDIPKTAYTITTSNA